MQQNNDINNIQVLEEEFKKYNTKDDKYKKIHNKIFYLKNKDRLNEKKKQKRIKQNIIELEKELTKYNTKDDEYIKIYNKLYNLKNKDKISNRRKQSRIELKKDKSYYNYLYFSGLITLSISSFIYFYYLKDCKKMY